MAKRNICETKRIYRHQRIRRHLAGTMERPRLCIHRSLKNFSASLIDDISRKVLMGMTTLAKEVKDLEARLERLDGQVVQATRELDAVRALTSEDEEREQYRAAQRQGSEYVSMGGGI